MYSNFDSFIQYLQYEKRFSKHTITAYSQDINSFFTYLTTTYQISQLSEITHSIIRSWIVYLMEQQITPRSINRKISTLKSFYKYMLRQNIVAENPMLKVQGPKTSKKLPVFIEKDKMNLLLDKTNFGTDAEGLQQQLILEMFYHTGMRLSELSNLKTNDVDLYNSQLKVLGKRNKERIIPFNGELKALIGNYMNSHLTPTSEYFFSSKSGEKLYPKFVYRVVNKYLSLISTQHKKSPHVLRHTFATHMLNNGADLNSIKELLGHASLSATQIYTHNTVEKLKNIHKQAHPKG
ncbi:MAG: tyrosine-type recombinase/integrase [Bacteroidia bacterium]